MYRVYKLGDEKVVVVIRNEKISKIITLSFIE